MTFLFSDYDGPTGGAYVATGTAILPMASEAGTIAAAAGAFQAGIADPEMSAVLAAEIDAIVAVASTEPGASGAE